MIPCGIPYIYGTVGSSDNNILPDAGLIKLGVDIVVGAGFIGVEISDELNKIGKDVTLVEILPNILGATFDDEFAFEAAKLLTERGVKVMTNCGINEIIGDGKVSQIRYNESEVIEADAVILALGYKPNTELAKNMGVELNEFGFIKADQYRRTSVPDVFAAGDCAEKVDFATGKLSKIMLASTACTEGRIAGLNLYELNTFSAFRGTVGIYSTCIGDSAFGGKCAGELTNAIGIVIQNHMTIYDLLMTQIGTQPLLTAFPAGFPLIKAAEAVVKTLRLSK
jgi:NADPH-dependent 2,4-dienoyl-CoA reductase/sulfur reductase-like enzyme